MRPMQVSIDLSKSAGYTIKYSVSCRAARLHAASRGASGLLRFSNA